MKIDLIDFLRLICKPWIFFLALFALPLSLFAISFSQLSLEEKAGQVLMVHFCGEIANEEARSLIQETYIGGMIYYNWANGLHDPEQILTLSQSLQQLAKETSHALPLLIAIDQEGGHVNRLKHGFTHFPGNYALGRTEEWQWGQDSAAIIGQELRAVGISLNLAPVIDIYTDPANPVIGIRAFSSDPKKVALWGKCTLQGYKQAGVIATLKHFPGHGDVKVDSHEMLPIISKNREALEQVELLPYRSLSSQADVIMTGHLLVPALDDLYCVTFSKKIVDDLLRKELNFEGVIMTDSLAMEGLLSQCSSIEEAVIKSLQAGQDLILLGGKQLLASQNGLEFTVNDVKRIHKSIIEAVKEGRLSEKRLDEAVTRLLTLKEKYGLFHPIPLENSMFNSRINIAEHRLLAQKIAQRALSLVKGRDALPLLFQAKSILIVAPDCLQEEISQTSWNTLGPLVKIIYFKGLNPDQAMIQKIKEEARNAKLCLYFAYNTWQFIGQREMVKELIKISPFTAAIVVRDPLDVEYLTEADLVLCTFSPVPCSLEAAFDYLIKRP
jgi:beta-N-acetylhexosaminidase